MSRLKIWFLERFVPAYVSIAEQAERERLREVIRDREGDIAQLDAYIRGMNRGYRNAWRSEVNTREVGGQGELPHSGKRGHPWVESPLGDKVNGAAGDREGPLGAKGVGY